MINPKKVIRSLISYLPIVKNVLKKAMPFYSSGKYCNDIYSVHKQGLLQAGFSNTINGKIIAEIGPGDSLGVGACALLDGFKEYYALDLINHSTISSNLKVLDDLYTLYPEKKDVIDTLRKEFISDCSNESVIKYYAPWLSPNIIRENTVDAIFSNAVMEHILDISGTYKAIYSWLKPGGYYSNLIDYGAHEFSDIWYEHIYINDFFWEFLMHGRLFPINRMPHSFHINEMKKAGFSIIYESKKNDRKANINKIKKNLRSIYTYDDLDIKGAHIVAQKPE
jgi:hypothetical protein